MSLRHLRTLIAVAECGSFAQAASHLGITQSAVSMQMRALEEELQARLFDRSRRPPAINALGRSLLERAREIVVLYESLQATASAELRGRLRLGAIPSISIGILPDALVDLRTLHPQVQVVIENGLSGALARRVIAGEIDAAIITEPAPANPELSCRTVMREPLIVAAPQTCTGHTEATLLDELPFIRFNRRAGVGRIIDEALRRRGIRVRETMELDSLEAILQMVSRGLGVAVVPEACIGETMASQVHRLPFGSPPVERAVGLLAPTRQRHAALIEALYQQLCRAARRTGLAQETPPTERDGPAKL